MTLHLHVTSVLLGFFDVFLIEPCTNLIRFDLVIPPGFDPHSLKGDKADATIQHYLKRTRIFRFNDRVEEARMSLVDLLIDPMSFPYPFIEAIWDWGRIISLSTHMCPLVAQETWAENAKLLAEGMELLGRNLPVEKTKRSSLPKAKRRVGRPNNSGKCFPSQIAFLLAIIDVIEKSPEELSESGALYRLSRHELWQGEALSKVKSSKNTRSLRRWLKDFNLIWEDFQKSVRARMRSER